MKPQVLHGNLTKLFYKTNRYGKYSVTVSAVESWSKIQKQLKNMLRNLLVLYLMYVKGNTSRFGSAIKVLPSDMENTLTHILLLLL